MKMFPQVERGENVKISTEFDHRLGHLLCFDEDNWSACFEKTVVVSLFECATGSDAQHSLDP